jgi:hypothetical protein
MKRALLVSLCIAGTLATVPCTQAQFPGITLPNGQGLVPMPSSPGFPVSDQATEINTDITATSETVGGMAGGFDPNLALAPDLQQQVSSTNGLPLDNNIPPRYPTLWPGYTNADYGQSYVDGSPEGDMLTTLGTLQGTLQAGANQQNSQMTELNRLQALEVENAAATGVFQLSEISNEVAIFEAAQEMKLRNSTNAQLNALVVAESNRQNKEAQDELLSLGAMTEVAQWDLTRSQIADPTFPDPPPFTTCGLCQTE